MFSRLCTLLAVGMVVVLSSGCLVSPINAPVSNPYGAIQASYIPASPVLPPWGILYTDYKAPLTINFDKTPVASGAPRTYEVKRIGIPFYQYLSVAWGDTNVGDLGLASGFGKVHYIDQEYLNILTVYQVHRFNVYGE